MTILRHNGHCSERGHARLADGHHMRAGAYHIHKRHQMFDVFVHAKASAQHGHVARVVPVCNVHVVIGKHGAYRFPQQGRKMARHGCNEQHSRLVNGNIFFEMQ